jgi:hypothetical protein
MPVMHYLHLRLADLQKTAHMVDLAAVEQLVEMAAPQAAAVDITAEMLKPTVAIQRQLIFLQEVAVMLALEPHKQTY